MKPVPRADLFRVIISALRYLCFGAAEIFNLFELFVIFVTAGIPISMSPKIQCRQQLSHARWFLALMQYNHYKLVQAKLSFSPSFLAYRQASSGTSLV